MGQGQWVLDMSEDEIGASFPRLFDGSYRITSPESVLYNCIAWATGAADRWWWPDPMFVGYWPEAVPRATTLSAFMTAFRSFGYEACDNGDLEEGFEKISIYVNHAGTPTHAARQLPYGWWTSKLGGLEDIEHESLEGLAGNGYGSVGAFMKRTA
jgi:hypothetical protein